MSKLTKFLDTRSFTYGAFALILFLVLTAGFYILFTKKSEELLKDRKK